MRRPREFPVEMPPTLQRGVDGPKNGIWVMRSEYERRQALRLIEAGAYFQYEWQHLSYLDKVVNGECLNCGSESVNQRREYTPDFYFPETKIFVETKGKFDAPNRTKMKQICQQSGWDIRMVFMRDNWLTKRRKMNYSRWCTINEIEFAVGDIPLEWTGV